MENKSDITTYAQLEEVVDEIIALLGDLNKKGAQVVALHGDLGAGKTTFIQELAKKMGVVEVVTSPTFVVMKNYEVDYRGVYNRLVHIDAYRIEDVDEMRVLGFEEILKESANLVCIEWAEKIAGLLPPDTVHLTFSLEEDRREITIKQNGN